ncbi:MAG: GNAT family N-acetyltransferase [Verrucomicrobia bacterium]|nr:GNAT family N-acetyltransferase [Verrucomicrobiota bacterium]
MSEPSAFAQDEEQVIPGLTVRYTQLQDAEHLKNWLLDPEVSGWFPMANEAEVEDAVRRWISFSRVKSSLTAELDGVPCGLVTLYVQGYKKLQHQSEFGIIVASGMRNKGIGSFLMRSMMRLAKEQFRLELVHLQVYAENPAIRLYKRFGFREFGRQTHWIKETDRYVGRIFMERFL